CGCRSPGGRGRWGRAAEWGAAWGCGRIVLWARSRDQPRPPPTPKGEGMRRLQRLAALTVVLTAPGLRAAPLPPITEERAVKELTKRGATVTRDEKRPGRPVVRVSLYA